MEANKLLTTNNGQQVLNETKVDNYMVVVSYTLKELITWWYIKMPIWHLKMLGRISALVDDNLSITLLLKNILTPWHRDNSIIGYTFGIITKLLYLPITLVIYLTAITTYSIIILIWLIMPLATIFFILRSLIQWQ